MESYKLLGRLGRLRYTALHGLLNVGQMWGKFCRRMSFCGENCVETFTDMI